MGSMARSRSKEQRQAREREQSGKHDRWPGWSPSHQADDYELRLFVKELENSFGCDRPAGDARGTMPPGKPERAYTKGSVSTSDSTTHLLKLDAEAAAADAVEDKPADSIDRKHGKRGQAGVHTCTAFRNGFLLSAGTALSVQGLMKAAKLVDFNSDDKLEIAFTTTYLLQIYAGIFLIILLALLFALACCVWHNCRIDYPSIFRYDTRHHLHWIQLAELPCWYLSFLGLAMQLNFHQIGGEVLYIYWPIILIGVSAIVLFNPIRMFYYWSRVWLLRSLWRLLISGVYPVEWRDFYLGDMFCSLAYPLSNIALSSCLYAKGWKIPSQCDSSHLRAMGVLSCLPGIWRALQSLRRYRDTGNRSPHLLNLGKYCVMVVHYMTLSIFRINRTHRNRAIFITFATINAMCTSLWDIYFDWRLGNLRAKQLFLREELGYKKIWAYYAAIVVDPILHFSWVLYLVPPLRLQDSVRASFAAGLIEIVRRGIWSIFRVENEHCMNTCRCWTDQRISSPHKDLPIKIVERPAPDDQADGWSEDHTVRKRDLCLC